MIKVNVTKIASINSLLDEMSEANRKAVEASNAYNIEVDRLVKLETKRAQSVTSDPTVIEARIRDIKDKSYKLKDLAGKQEFFSREVLRISALLQGLAAHEQLVKWGLGRAAI